MSEFYRPFVRQALHRSIIREAMEFNSPEARKNYLKEHPDADPSKHTVKKPDGPKPSGEPESSSSGGGVHEALSSLKGLSGKELKKGISAARKAVSEKRKEISKQVKALESEKKLSDQAVYHITNATKALQIYDKKLAEIGRKGKGDVEKYVDLINKEISSAEKHMKSGPPKPKEKKPKENKPKKQPKEDTKEKKETPKSEDKTDKSDDNDKKSEPKAFKKEVYDKHIEGLDMMGDSSFGLRYDGLQEMKSLFNSQPKLKKELEKELGGSLDSLDVDDRDKMGQSKMTIMRFLEKLGYE